MKDQLKAQQRRMMLYNLVAFSIIFTLFGAILYSQIKTYLFQPVLRVMESSRENILEGEDWVERQLEFQAAMESGEGKPPQGSLPDKEGARPDNTGRRDGIKGRGEVPMHVQTILRDSQGQVLNPRALGQLYFHGYLDYIPVAGEGEMDQVTAFAVGDSSYYSLTFQLWDKGGEGYTVQLITNIDGEQAILSNFSKLLILCIVVFVLLSLLASYLLSKKTMAPIVTAWNRQTEFVANASHELRTPLAIIQNKMESMLTHPGSTVMEQAGEIGVTLSETRRLSKLTSDLMTLARADSNETVLEQEPFPLDQMIAQVTEPYAEMAQMQEKTLTTRLEFGRDLRADRARIHELMVILLDNALKYTGPGDAIHLSTSFREGRAVIRVGDTGLGIDEESRWRVFDRFYRADKARSREQGGSGLGLSIAKWIVDAHGGSISIAPREGGGTEVQVKL